MFEFEQLYIWHYRIIYNVCQVKVLSDSGEMTGHDFHYAFRVSGRRIENTGRRGLRRPRKKGEFIDYEENPHAGSVHADNRDGLRIRAGGDRNPDGYGRHRDQGS